MAPSSTGGTGTELTCDIQGCFYSAGDSASGAYNVMLAIVYLLIVKYNYSEEQLQKLKPWLHTYPVLAAAVFLADFPFKGFNRTEEAIWCSLIPLDSCAAELQQKEEDQVKEDEQEENVVNARGGGMTATILKTTFYFLQTSLRFSSFASVCTSCIRPSSDAKYQENGFDFSDLVLLRL
jgi:hypothetical protein